MAGQEVGARGAVPGGEPVPTLRPGAGAEGGPALTGGGSPPRVNFVHTSSPNYHHVQNQLYDLVREQLPPGTSTDSVDETVPAAVNLGLHIRYGKGDRQRPQVAQALMSHGVADKNYFFLRNVETGEPLVNHFGSVLLPGEWLRRRLLAARDVDDPRRRVTLQPEQLVVVGWPRLDLLMRRAAEVAARPVPLWRRPRRRPRLLWAPSHDLQRVRGTDERISSYPAFEEYLPRLRRVFDVQVSLHPRNRRRKQPTGDLLLEADVVVSDFGTLLYESWALGKCTVLPSWLMPTAYVQSGPRTAERHVYRERIGLHAGSFDELVDLARGGAPPGADVTAFLDDYLAPQYRGTSARRVAEVLRTLPPAPG